MIKISLLNNSFAFFEYYFLIILAFLLVISLLSLFTKNNLLVIGIILSFFSLGSALFYTLLAAPDVAITEAAVGASASTLILLAAYNHFAPTDLRIIKIKHELLPLLACALFFASLVLVIQYLPPYGDSANPAHHSLSNYYLTNTAREVGIKEIVTAILADYRAYDTLGETAVIVLAALGALLLFSINKGEKNAD